MRIGRGGGLLNNTAVPRLSHLSHSICVICRQLSFLAGEAGNAVGAEERKRFNHEAHEVVTKKH
jgi:hypothetical protein